MKQLNVILMLLAVFAALRLFAIEVPVLTPEQESFMKMSPAERRERFTNEAYRAALAQHNWEKMKWREAVEGESSRWRHLPGVPNMRDLGGLNGLDGRPLRRGMIFRSGGFNDNAKFNLVEDEKNPGKQKRQYYGRGKDRLTESSRRFQIEHFGIRTDIDLRSDGECNEMTGSPLGPQTVWAHHPSKSYESFHSREGRDAFKADFAYFLHPTNYPIAFHCIAGADRTGSLAYALEALLGVSDADLCLDWELTAFHNPNHKFAHADRYDRLVRGFMKYPGASTRERVEAFAKEQGFTDADISKFREIMLVPRTEIREIAILDGEGWWGVENFQGSEMPFTRDTVLTMDIRKDGCANQYASLLLSDFGRVVWCEAQVGVTISNGVIRMEGDAPVALTNAGSTLRDAFRFASRTYFPPSGKMPDPLFFSAPQYNTWIELTYHQNQKDILSYAKSMLDNGLPPGIFMIDDTWQRAYGDWYFEASRFPDPKAMMNELHWMGFKVMLWMCPFVGMDTASFRRLAWAKNPDDVKGWPTKGGLLGPENVPAAVQWWNGYSACLDLTHPNANAWLKEQLDRLVRDYGADGFKLDGGHLIFYSKGLETFRRNATGGEQVLEYAKYALQYPCCEYRNAWRFQGQPVVERLHDKDHTWEALRKLIPDMIAGGLLGHSFMCPDMIGGGSHTAFLPGAPFDPDLFVRSAQVHALCGMMQFSASPWRYLDKERQQIVRNIVKMRQEKFAEFFVRLAKDCGRTGEPMIRNLEYEFPHQGYAAIHDEFMMGDRLLVAPVMESGSSAREVVIPPGVWTADDGTVVSGPCRMSVQAPLSRLPYFMRH